MVYLGSNTKAGKIAEGERTGNFFAAVIQYLECYTVRTGLSEEHLKRILDVYTKTDLSLKVLKTYNRINLENYNNIVKAVKKLNAGEQVNLEKIIA